MNRVRIAYISNSWAERRAQVVEALASLTDPSPAARAGVESIKAEGDSAVLAAHMVDRPVILKRRRLRGWGDRLRCRLGWSRLARQHHGVQVLDRAGVRTAPVLARATVTTRYGRFEVLVLERVEGPTLLELLADRAAAAGSSARSVAAEIGRMLARLAHAGVFNRDGKPSNIVLSRFGAVVIDTVGVRPVRASERNTSLARMLAALMLEPIGCGLAIPTTSRRRVLRAMLVELWSLQARPGEDASANDPAFSPWERHSARFFWLATAKRIADHGDPTPKIDPLAATNLSR